MSRLILPLRTAIWWRVETGWETVCLGIKWTFIVVSSPVWGLLWLIGTGKHLVVDVWNRRRAQRMWWS